MKRKNIEKCRGLRKNQTEAEKKLWAILRNRQVNGLKFRRQFSMGNYIIDFYSPELKLGIEVDGGEHYENKFKMRDKIRSRELAKQGIEIIRFNNNEVLRNIEGVIEIIFRKLKERKSPSPSSSPRGERSDS